MFIEHFVVSPWQTNCYLLGAGDGTSTAGQPAVVIDPGIGARDQIESALDVAGLKLTQVICTHGHVDHVADAAELANEHRVPLWLHPADHDMLIRPALGLDPASAAWLDQLLGCTELPAPHRFRELADGQELDLAGADFRALHVPGHTPGCVVLLGVIDGTQILFSGDVLFAGSIGRVDLPGGSMSQMTGSLRRLRSEIPAETSVLPGHGPFTQMSRELAANPYLNQEL